MLTSFARFGALPLSVAALAAPLAQAAVVTLVGGNNDDPLIAYGGSFGPFTDTQNPAGIPSITLAGISTADDSPSTLPPTLPRRATACFGLSTRKPATSAIPPPARLCSLNRMWR